MRLSHVKHNRVSVVEEEQTMLDALRDSCGLSCQETEGCIKRAAGRDQTGKHNRLGMLKHL